MSLLQKNKSPLSWIISLYGAEGIILNVITVVIMMYYKSMGVTDTRTAFWTSWLMLPWTIKPFWAPFLELIRYKKRAVLAMQFGSAGIFLLVAGCLTTAYWFQATIALLFIGAFIGATHDIAADGTYLDALSETERESYVGFQSAAWMSGRALSVGAFVWLAGTLVNHFKAQGSNQIEAVTKGWTMIFLFIGLFMLIVATYHAVLLPKGKVSEIQTHTAKEVASAYLEIVKNFFQKPNIIRMILFVFLYRFSYAHVEKIGPLFLKSEISAGGLGLNEDLIGKIYGGLATAGLLFGSIVGGKLVKRFTLKRMILILATLLNLPILLFVYLAWAQPTNTYIIGTVLTIELFCSGIGMVGSITYMMNQLAPGKYQMAHYGIATAVMGLGMMLPGMFSGWISDHIGYKLFFIYAFATAIFSFIVAWKVPFREIPKDTETTT